ncbi:MAG: bile acid:sodium symporter [Candidatus Saganbacteria bacterium]|nr:bile acid:sodium symporter [Candidatus Saganbacteria bacterium]
MSLQSIIKILISLSMYTFILSSLFGAGLGLTVREIIEPLKKVKTVLLAILANFILIPALAYALSILFHADSALQTGLIIIASCAGAPFLPKLVTTAKGNLAYSIGLMVLLMVATVVFIPLVLPLLIPGLSISPWAIAKPLIILMLLPLILGLLIRALKPNFALLIKPFIEKTSSISLILWGVLALLVDYKVIISAYGSGVYNLTGLFTIGALLIGYILGGSNKEDKIVMMFGSGARNIAAALLVAVSNFDTPRIITVVLIGSIVQFVFSFVLALWYKRR